MATINKGPDLCYARGDLGPITLRFKDDSQSSGNYNFTGFTSIELTIDTLENPTDALTNVMTMTGTFNADRESGLAAFNPPDQGTSDALTPASGLFYDVQSINSGGERITLLKGGDFEIIQDINKG
jgi:hypothetical protein